MSDKYTEYNPDKGTYETVDLTQYESEGKIGVYHQEDLTELVKQCNTIRNQGLADKGIKRSWWPWLRLSTTQVMFLLTKGINVHDKNLPTRDLEAAARKYFPHMFLTDKRVN